jgi:LmbE family N-acetylglucosaminyl deacetylase
MEQVSVCCWWLAYLLETQENNANNRNRRRVVCIGAHPDDVELGMAGTVAKHSRRGDDVLIIICTLGIGGESGDPRQREEEAKIAAKILGARVLIIDYPVTKLNQPTFEFTSIMTRILEQISPHRLYTHSPFDYHQVHESVTQCVLQSALSDATIPQILLYEEASSTSPEFTPNAYVDITDYIQLKIGCLRSHRTQVKKLYMQENIAKSIARTRYVLGKIGTKQDGMAEAFAIARFVIDSTQLRRRIVQQQEEGTDYQNRFITTSADKQASDSALGSHTDATIAD